jgi:ABC-2 type transport system ATP-binding protein
MHVHTGDCYGFIGHNGAGKTTAMRIALGLQRADRGTVLVDGFDIRKQPREARARMAGLIETPGFDGQRSGMANLVELARLQGYSRSAARVEAAREIERVGLDHAAERRVQGYSQGMRQRLGIAQALLGKPAYVLLDEPTNGLDPEGIADMRALVGRLVRDEKLTVVVSSHQLHELTGLCNRIAVLRRGRVLIEEETAKLLAGDGARYRLETPDAAEARSVLERGAIRVEARADGALDLALNSADAPRVAGELVRAGVRIASFAPHGATLEEIYLRLAHGEQTVKSAPVDATRNVDAADARPLERRAPPRPVAMLFGYETRRLAGRFAVALFALLPALLAAAAVLWRNAQARADVKQVEGAQLFSATAVTAFEGVGVALQAGLPLLAFVALGVASQSVSSELSSGTLRNVLLRPIRRWQVAVGKALACACAVVASYAMLVGCALLVARACFEFTDVAEILPNGARYPLVRASELWPVLRATLAAPLLPLVAYTSLGFLAGTVARTAAGGLALALCAGVGLDLARVVARAFDVEGGLLSAYVPSPLGDTSPMHAFVEMSQGISNTHFDYARTLYSVPAAWIAVCMLLAVATLARRSVP